MLAQFLIEGVFTALLGLFGIAGNIVSIKVMSSKDLDMLPTFRHLLKMLAGFDATFLIFTLSLFCVSSWSPTYDQYVRPYLTPYWLPVIQIALAGSVWTTMAVSVERYLTVCCSYRSNKVQHLYYTVPIIVSSFLFNAPRFFELRTGLVLRNETIYNETTGEEVNITIMKPELQPTELRKDPGYSRDYVLIANSFALAFFPMLALVVLNSLIFRTISKATERHNAISSHQRRDHKVAMMLIILVVVFIICHSLRSIINTYECIQLVMYGELKNWPDWIQVLVHGNHFALVFNSSINIMIYACKDDKFLNVLLITIHMRPGRGRSRSPDLELNQVNTSDDAGSGSLGRNAIVKIRTALKSPTPSHGAKMASEIKLQKGSNGLKTTSSCINGGVNTSLVPSSVDGIHSQDSSSSSEALQRLISHRSGSSSGATADAAAHNNNSINNNQEDEGTSTSNSQSNLLLDNGGARDETRPPNNYC